MGYRVQYGQIGKAWGCLNYHRRSAMGCAMVLHVNAEEGDMSLEGVCGIAFAPPDSTLCLFRSN